MISLELAGGNLQDQGRNIGQHQGTGLDLFLVISKLCNTEDVFLISTQQISEINISLVLCTSFVRITTST